MVHQDQPLEDILQGEVEELLIVVDHQEQVELEEVELVQVFLELLIQAVEEDQNSLQHLHLALAVQE
jgi:hypothetical protein